MYLPAHFAEGRVPVLHEAIRGAGLASLVTSGPDGPEVSHVPLLLDTNDSPLGTLRGHLARANPHWRTASTDQPALAVFLGPDAYVTPSWYPTKAQTGEVVPTWNYVAVHARGHLTFFEDPERLLALVGRLTEIHEAGRAAPWAVGDAPGPYVAKLLNAIVGFELRIDRLEGKWKASQNRSAEDRAGVAEGLVREGGEAATAMAALVRRGGASR
jgi:transcriptional regulator